MTVKEIVRRERDKLEVGVPPSHRAIRNRRKRRRVDLKQRDL